MKGCMTTKMTYNKKCLLGKRYANDGKRYIHCGVDVNSKYIHLP